MPSKRNNEPEQTILAAFSVRKTEEAVFHFERALEMDPSLSEAACACAKSYLRLGSIREAETMYRRAMQLDPECQEARVALEQIAIREQAAIFFQG